MPAPDRHDDRRGLGSDYLLLICLLTLLWISCQAHSEDASTGPPLHAVPVLIRLNINGLPVKNTVMALQTPDKNWWLPSGVLSSAGIRIPKTQPIHF
jgi:hypothetical protein